jgi:hypothetical protein
LNYELDTYLDALQGFPENADMLRVVRGTATLIKKDIFKNLMWYVLPDSNKQFPLTIERVTRIKTLNSQNIIPEELEPVDVTTMKQKEIEAEFVDVVGHITLKSLEKSDKKRHQQQRSGQQQRGGTQQRQTGPPQKGMQKNPGQQEQQKNIPGPKQRQGPQQRGQNPQQKFRPDNRKGGQGSQGNNPQQPPQRPTIDKDKDQKKD